MPRLSKPRARAWSAVGHRVLVCDNLAFSGDLIGLRRRHTGEVDLEQEVERAVDRFLLAYQGLAEDMHRLKRRHLSDNAAREWILRVLREGPVPGKYVGAVLDNYFSCPLPAFRERTLCPAQRLHQRIPKDAAGGRVPRQRDTRANV